MKKKMGYKFPQKGKKWRYKISPECLDAMIKEKIRPAHIAKMCNLSRQAVHLRVQKLGKAEVYLNVKSSKYDLIRRLNEKGYTAEEIKDLMGFNTKQNVLNYLDRMGLRQNLEINKRWASVIFWRNKGYSASEISRILPEKVKPVAISEYLRRRGSKAVDGRKTRPRKKDGR